MEYFQIQIPKDGKVAITLTLPCQMGNDDFIYLLEVLNVLKRGLVKSNAS